MGESSAKNLRGEAMTDVIFNGSGGRKPVGQASIELVFDNSDGTLTGEYAGFTEISIKRKVTRESQNIYYLNGAKCRRRDITDIFLGTGLGPRSYAIIEQGMISKLIEAKPEELRVFIEEAAGISKYKERRRDTENRMRRTHENLERLTDLRDELERQLSRLERQAQSAEKYKEFKEIERDLKSKLQAFRYRLLEHQSAQKQKVITELELNVEAGVTEQVHHDSSIEKHRTEYTELSDAFNEVQGRFYAIGADIARIEQSIQHAKERENQLRVDLDETIRHCDEANEHLQTDQAKAEGWEAELLEIEPELEMIQEAEESSGEELLAAEDAMHAWQQDWDQFNLKAAEPRQQAEVQQSRIKYLEQVQQKLVTRLEKLELEREGLDCGDVSEEIEVLDESVASLELNIEEKTEQLEHYAEKITELRDVQQNATEERDQMRSELQTSKGRFASLEALQQAALGSDSKDLTNWLDSQGLSSAEKLAEKLNVEDGWDLAVETVLGKTLQAIISSEPLEQLEASLNELSKGEVVVFEKGEGAQSTDAKFLQSKVKSDVCLGGLLDGVLYSEDVHEALAQRHSLQPGQSIVTKDGVWVGKNWIRVAKGDNTNSGVIARKQELEELGEKISHLEEKIDLVSETLEGVKSQLMEAEESRDAARRELTDLTKKHSEVRSDLSAKKAKVQQVLEGRERNQKDIAEGKEQLEQEAENLAEARSILEEAIAAMEEDTEEREKFLNRRDEIRGSLDNARQKARHDKDKSHALALRFQSTKGQLESVKQGIGRLQEQLQRMQERRETLQENLSQVRDPAEENKLELEAHLEKRVAVEGDLAEARRKVEAVESAMRDAEKQRQKVEQALIGLRTKLETERLEAKSLDVKREGLKQQLDEDGLEVDAVIDSLEEGLEESQLEQDLEKIGNRISRLGPINLAAIDEYKVESERKEYLDAQNADLNEALETLEAAIKKIDRETRTRFKETFDQVNGGLQELFPKVFGGGHAYLELTGEDMLDTGIAIMARPPGKKNSTIHLLSGGEKALTAIALVFSIFRLNPAPFCMLDEVDAPLDDANVGRYARMVEEMSAQVQFIYITHNKIAMEMAHQLMGVTMHEPGVSRMVTVDVEEAAELAAI